MDKEETKKMVGKRMEGRKGEETTLRFWIVDVETIAIKAVSED